MYTFYRGSGIFIPKEYEHEPFYFQIKEFLKRRTKSYNTSDYVTNQFYLESDKGLLIPRFFPLDRFIRQQYTIEEKLLNKSDRIRIEHNITPRNETQQEAINYMSTYSNGILQLPPGVGKTVITIFMIATRKLKSLILVHRDSLVDQWMERFLQFTNLALDDEVRRLSSATFIEDLKKPIVVSTVQTFLSLLKRNRRQFLVELGKSNFGILVADEVHTSVGAPSFSECSIHTPAQYVFGLSATPYRHDGNEDVIKFHLGEIFSKDNDEGTMKADVIILFLDYKIDTPKRHKYLYWAGEFQRSRYLNLMGKSENFINVTKSILNKLKGNKNIIYVCERIKIIEGLYEWLDHTSKSKFIGSAKQDQLSYEITFATPGKIRDGVDVPEKDALIMSSPISNIEQMCGRINRSHFGKQTPIVIDMVDVGCKRISMTVFKRLKFYKSKEWNIKYMFASEKSKSVVEIPEETVYEMLKGDK